MHVPSAGAEVGEEGDVKGIKSNYNFNRYKPELTSNKDIHLVNSLSRASMREQPLGSQDLASGHLLVH